MKALVSVLVLSLVCASAVADTQEEKDENAKFFVRSYSTTTWTFLSSLTSTVPYTCYTTGGATACSGRRRRRSKKLQLSIDDAQGVDDLSSSGADEHSASERDDDDSSLQDKFLFTLWKTSSTTVTITTFSTNRSVTVSVSIYCTYQGIALQLCG
ncbi:uncharacterized protein [Panulirus ornatus]|uniref:uncharacterized protein n=1 Tax=Panulirus ornatus TaxID=150431 RepID=UPI003A83D5C5